MVRKVGPRLALIRDEEEYSHMRLANWIPTPEHGYWMPIPADLGYRLLTPPGVQCGTTMFLGWHYT